MSKPRISLIFGTRPEAIKLAPVILALRQIHDLDCHVCSTGQHREMLDQVLDVFKIRPDTDLNLMSHNQELAQFTSRALSAVDVYLNAEKPDMVLVQGDTTTVFCAALAAFYRQIPVGHVEAGLRTWNMRSPWPEEANRVLTSRLATLHFAPTESARQNLLREGICNDSIQVTGNTVIDALFIALDKVKRSPPVITGLPPNVMQDSVPLVLITGHRRENFGNSFENICRAIADLARAFPKVQFVYPVHLNPNVREPVLRILGGSRADAAQQARAPGNIHLIEPLSYSAFVALMNRATIILTDSGGIQEEAPSLRKPVLVMRDTTERPEAMVLGTVKLVGTDRARIGRQVTELLSTPSAREAMSQCVNPYGDGQAALRIVEACRTLLNRRP